MGFFSELMDLIDGSAGKKRKDRDRQKILQGTIGAIGTIVAIGGTAHVIGKIKEEGGMTSQGGGTQQDDNK